VNEQSVLFAAFFFALVSTFTPGPNNIMLLSSGLNYGARRTIPHGLGIIFGFPLMVFGVGMGLGSLFELYPLIHAVLKVISVVYLLFLAWRIATTDTEPLASSKAKPLTFFQALAFQWVNPKAWIMALGAMSTYTVMGQSMLTQVLAITLCFFVVAIFSTSVWTYCGVILQKILSHRRQRRIFNIAMGVLLVAAVLPMINTAG
jgi:threonine/homoserine/homoserine lactone efflux protein